MLNDISEQELDSLPLGALVQRMDDFLIHAQHERYAGLIPANALLSDIFNTSGVQHCSEIVIRRIVYLAFSYLIQIELLYVSTGMANKVLYTETHKPSDWTSPAFRLRHGSIKQYQIVASRIAFEIFIDLLHVIETGERIQGKKSKLKVFRVWLCNANNKFHYFAHALLVAYHFDRQFRSPEVHGASPLPRKMLMLTKPSRDEMNEEHKLFNTILNLWRPLIDILNNVRPSYMHINLDNDDWFKAYISGNDDVIEAKLDEMFDNLS